MKVRTGEFQFDAENVLVMEVNKDDGYLKFDVMGCAREDDHLNKLDGDEIANEIMELLMMQRSGMSIRQIAEEKCMSKSTVQRRLENAKKSNITVPEESVPVSSNVPLLGQLGQLGQGTQVSLSGQATL